MISHALSFHVLYLRGIYVLRCWGDSREQISQGPCSPGLVETDLNDKV